MATCATVLTKTPWQMNRKKTPRRINHGFNRRTDARSPPTAEKLSQSPTDDAERGSKSTIKNKAAQKEWNDGNLRPRAISSARNENMTEALTILGDRPVRTA